MLLEDIISLSTDGGNSVGPLLRKCLILGDKLGNESLVRWVDQELNGYPDGESVPDYRVIRAPAKGLMSGFGGARIDNFPIPPAMLDEKHQDLATRVHVSEAVSSIEDLISRGEGQLRAEWPSNFVLYYQNRIRTQNGCYLAQAWQIVDRSALVQIIEAVRNRILRMALEIGRTVGKSDKQLESVGSDTVEKIQRTVINNIYGGTNTFASGNSHVTNTVTNISTTITAGNIEQLSSALLGAGIPQESLKQLSEAIKRDSDTFGSRVRDWVKENAPKAVMGGVKLGATVAGPMLTGLLKQYLGLN